MNTRFIDDLKRAYEMEERMASVLIDLCEPNMTEIDSLDKKIGRIRALLVKIQRDTIRHKELVHAMLSELGGKTNG